MENPGGRFSCGSTRPHGSMTCRDFADNGQTMLLRIHHAAIICSDYERSKRFYTQVLGEHWRAERRSWKLDLALPDGSQIELFSFEDRPARPSYPEARGLRHLAFEVADAAASKAALEAWGVTVEAIRVDEYTGRRFTFFADPDDLPLELYESA
jgi:glyoxylase I family protein